MTTSVIIGAVIIVAVLAYIVYLTKKSKRHLDDLHITGTNEKTRE